MYIPVEPEAPVSDLGRFIYFLYGPPKVGKSTLASEFPGVYFADVEKGLKSLSVRKSSINGWLHFLDFLSNLSRVKAAWSAYDAKDREAWAAACTKPLANRTGDPRIPKDSTLETLYGYDPEVPKAPVHERPRCVAVDTIDRLFQHCMEYVLDELGIDHPSDAEWGKGWAMLSEEFARPFNQALDWLDLGMIFISHAQTRKVKVRRMEHDMTMPTLGNQPKKIIMRMADVVLYCEYGVREDERWLICQPSATLMAGDRTRTLPPKVEMSYDALQDAFNKGMTLRSGTRPGWSREVYDEEEDAPEIPSDFRQSNNGDTASTETKPEETDGVATSAA